MTIQVLSVLGTRPEAIKMAPLIRQLEACADIQSVVCTTGQHSTLLTQVLDLFELRVDHDLQVMTPGQNLNSLCARLFAAFDPVLQATQPDRVLVHGDTTTAMVCALAAFHRGIAVGHVEAGLRTYNLAQPWPEEANRRVVDLVSDLRFVPTPLAHQHLLQERLMGRNVVTGNTVIDALHVATARLNRDHGLRARVDANLPRLGEGRRMLLVTGHRRESFGGGFESICQALATLSQRPDLEIVYPVHLNPHVQGPVQAMLGGLPHIHLLPPQDYLHFVRLMQCAHVVLTDSGGVQEEAPSLGKPVLVMRDVTERPEAVTAGTVELVGTRCEHIVRAVANLFDNPQHWQAFATAHNPYGDGQASARIVASLRGLPFEEFAPPCKAQA